MFLQLPQQDLLLRHIRCYNFRKLKVELLHKAKERKEADINTLQNRLSKLEEVITKIYENDLCEGSSINNSQLRSSHSTSKPSRLIRYKHAMKSIKKLWREKNTLDDPKCANLAVFVGKKKALL